ncbi:segregation/condensation protein A [Methanocaldococcus infernus]|uniref:Chromosome segregation and condensation protein ScpA n=1 Tax=Methanocaldococcus infernus (strain DSM 11812 / JCM 15783 / ME) TaxID=573063 RepID=D5VSV7_METIM|nr:segregation/condensation protein A [Methanocaldococcus infernus]ADG13660.1 chromosome segregation and condensation protein ScpA [Methanocaldococcus infernus ME]
MDVELWVRIVKEGIRKKRLNPWDVNIGEVAEYYINKIKELKKFDIRLGADLVLVGAILLRMKSESLYNSFEDKKEEKKRKRRKKISEEELIENVKKELKKIKKNNKRKKKKMEEKSYIVEELVNEMLEEDDVDELINFLLSLIKNEKIIIFQEKFKNRDEKIKYFLPALCLANDNLIEIQQEEMFKELILKLKEGKDGLF